MYKFYCKCIIILFILLSTNAWAINVNKAQEFIGEEDIIIIFNNTGGRGRCGVIQDVVFIEGKSYILFDDGGIKVIPTEEIIYMERKKEE